MAQINAVRAQGKEHFPPYPHGFTVLRIFQLVFSIIILGVVSYTVYVLAFSGNCLMLFTTVVTFIASLYMVIANQSAHQLYNYWAVLSLDIFLVIFWLISFALLASQTAYLWAVGGSYCDYYSCYYGSLSGSALIYGAILATACGLGALEFLFFFISLIIHSVAVCRHRRSGLHCNPAPAGTGAVAVAVPVQMQTQHPHGMINYQGPPQFGAPMGQNPGLNTQSVYNPALPPQGYPPQGYPPQQQLGEKPMSPAVPHGQQQFYTQPPPLVPQTTGGSSVHQPPVHHSPPPMPQGTYQPPHSQPTPPPAPQAPTYQLP
ncbi:hypothetical protein B0J13DRAFT_225163 [Dactylonectria estremocensis]|uniref:MARVEL domain-containing protein n=1 Tax=Dactylonectria estremocensis TaxID=1079267 RepID=A0A9P9F7U8_9HYPO|nr:hypothetical protein B0J13DRAFT_225163 [Dactylonectria estremocensis]